MKHSIELRMAVAAALLVFAFAMSGLAQQSVIATPITTPSESVQSVPPPHVLSRPGTLFIPKSSQPQTIPAGHKFVGQTNVGVFIPAGITPDEAPPFLGLGYETPASLACHYGLVTEPSGVSPNCNPNVTTVNPTGGGNTIAIVDAYDDPEAPSDLAYFSDFFGIPFSVSQFQVVWANTYYSSCYYSGVPIDYSGESQIEEATDIEWAHAMAPGANIYLVEACSMMDTDLLQAILVANNLVQCGNTEMTSTGVGTCPTGSTGKGEVSMSWSGGEFASETGTSCTASSPTFNDGCFTTPGVVYVAAAGDYPGTWYPCTSPNVVCAGGTTNRRNASTLNFEQEAAWVYGGGGQSYYEPIPSYQSTYIPSICTGGYRCVPDLSFDADYFTGVYVYDTFPYDYYYYSPWQLTGGTSVSAPSLAGIINVEAIAAGRSAASSIAENTWIYKYSGSVYAGAYFTDITNGFCGYYMGLSSVSGWDFCTGVGVDKGYAGK